ncbi:MAG: hypothetical protein HY067_14855 [Betaproteobacteria bacterium]|nr:hypothetical protein [Betaproteobacteria bacterium]
MNTSRSVLPAGLYKRHGFLAGICGYRAYLYFRFSLSFRHIGKMMAKHGAVLSYDTVRNLI